MNNRNSHPPLSGSGISLNSSTSTFTSSLPPSKPPSSSSSYQSGTKFHSSSTSSVEHVKGPPSTSSSTQDQEITEFSTPSFSRHRIHRRTKDQDGKVVAGNNALPAIKESLPAGNCGGRSGVQFDLEASAFPPLPGLDTDLGKTSVDVSGNSGVEQNRLSDVVKGTAKLKAIKDKDNQQQQQQPPPANASRSASPGASTVEAQSTLANSMNPANALVLNPPANNENSADAVLSTVTLTPPSSPDK